MKKEKTKSDRGIKGKARDSSTSRRNELSGRNGISVSVECGGSFNMKKRVIIKDDGRYLIYYDFQA